MVHLPRRQALMIIGAVTASGTMILRGRDGKGAL